MEDRIYGFFVYGFIIAAGVWFFFFHEPPYHEAVQEICAERHQSKEYEVINEQYFCIDVNGEYHKLESSYKNYLDGIGEKDSKERN